MESAVAKSEYSQGKKLKVVTKVGFYASTIKLQFLSLLIRPFLQINPDILGGLIVEIGDRTIDLSVSSKIARMNKLLTDTI